MAAHKPITILHISDVQVEGSWEEKMLDMLLYDLNSISTLYGLSPSIVVASGDLAEQGEDTEFERVSNFLNRLTNQLKLTKENVVIVPGNHDIHWPSCIKYLLHRTSNMVFSFMTQTSLSDPTCHIEFPLQIHTTTLK